MTDCIIIDPTICHGKPVIRERNALACRRQLGGRNEF